MLEFQSEHGATGHTIRLLGHEYQSAPRWANFVYFAQGTSRWLVLVLVIGRVAAFVSRPDRLVAYLAIALGAQGVFLTSSHVALGHYYYAWMPLLIAVAGIGFWRAGWPARHRGRRRALFRMAAVGLVLALTVAPVVRLGAAVAQGRVAGIGRLDAELRARGVDDGTILFCGYIIVAWKPYFPPPRGTWERDADDLTAVVQGVDGRLPMPPGVASFFRTHHDELEHFTVDELQVWISEHGSIRERDYVLELAP